MLVLGLGLSICTDIQHAHLVKFAAFFFAALTYIAIGYRLARPSPNPNPSRLRGGSALIHPIICIFIIYNLGIQPEGSATSNLGVRDFLISFDFPQK